VPDATDTFLFSIFLPVSKKQEDVEMCHSLYFKSVADIFERNKATCGYPDHELVRVKKINIVFFLNYLYCYHGHTVPGPTGARGAEL